MGNRKRKNKKNRDCLLRLKKQTKNSTIITGSLLPAFSLAPFDKIILLRHGSTPANHMGQYIGHTDICLSTEGVQNITDLKPRFANIIDSSNPDSFILIASPLQRCLKTADLLCPEKKAFIMNHFIETDFGDWEGLTYEQLKNNSDYITWINSGYGSDFSPPNGESSAQVIKRVLAGWDLCRMKGLEFKKQSPEEISSSPLSLCIITHGGIIMTFLTLFSGMKKSFYHWQIKPGKGYWLSKGGIYDV